MFYFFLLTELLSIFFYMKGGILGIIFFLINCLFVILCKQSLPYKTMLFLIASLPFSFIGIGGMEMPHILSWYNVFLVVFIILNFRNFRLSNSALVAVLVIFVCLMIASLWAIDLAKAWVEITQILVMLVPTVVVFCSRKKFPLNGHEINQLFTVYAHVAFCTAVGMIIQYYFVYFRGADMGMLNIAGGGRISCNALFRGASILPIYMGSGLVVLFMKSFFKKSYIEYLEIVVIFSAMILNTSRTGVFALFCVIGYIMFIRLTRSFSIKTILLFIALAVLAYYGLEYLMSTRSNLGSFTEDNGREETYINGINIWLHSSRNFFFGEGFTGGMWDGITKTHNFVIQTLAQNGIIVASIVFILILKFVKSTQKSPLKYVIWFILLSCLLVTDIYANAFTSVAFILVSLHSCRLCNDYSIKYSKLI